VILHYIIPAAADDEQDRVRPRACSKHHRGAGQPALLNVLFIRVGVARLAKIGHVGSRTTFTPSQSKGRLYNGERLITRVDAASDPSRIGSDQVRGCPSRASAWF
jgi:hypothetical protein